MQYLSNFFFPAKKLQALFNTLPLKHEYVCSMWIYFCSLTLSQPQLNAYKSNNRLKQNLTCIKKPFFPQQKPRFSKECNLSSGRGVGHTVALKGVDAAWHGAGQQPSSFVRGAALHNGENAIIMGTKAPCGNPKPDLLFGSGWLLCRYFISWHIQGP